MSYFENFLKANQAYVELHGDLHLSIKPKTKVAIVTCMDSRLHVAPALGLALGDAHILRNAGGRVTEDMIRSLVISQQQMGTREIVVLHHTDCGAQTFENGPFQEYLKGLCTTVCMMEHHNFPCPHLLLGNHKRANHIICHSPSSIPQNMSISQSQPKSWRNV